MTRLVAWLGFLGLALAGLHATPIPPGDGVTAAFAGVRLIALGLGWYLLAVTVLSLLARGLRIGAAVRLADLVTVPFVRRLVNRAASVVLVASLAAPTAVAVAVSPAAAATAPVQTSAATDPPVMHLIDEAPEPAPAPAAPAATDSYEIRPGDNFWSIASRVMGDQLARPATDAEIAPYWRTLIAANADRVRDPSLVFSGQVLRVPAPLQLPRTD